MLKVHPQEDRLLVSTNILDLSSKAVVKQNEFRVKLAHLPPRRHADAATLLVYDRQLRVCPSEVLPDLAPRAQLFQCYFGDCAERVSRCKPQRSATASGLRFAHLAETLSRFRSRSQPCSALTPVRGAEWSRCF